MCALRSTTSAPSSVAAHARRAVTTSILTIALVATIGAHAQPPISGQPVRADNYYAAGNRIEITTPMPADVIVAARRIDIVQPVAGDILAAGWRVALSARADDDVRIAAGEVTVNAPVTGDLTAAGGDITLGPQTHVSGRTWLTGNTVPIEGVLERDLYVAGATVELAGEIRQPVRIVAEKLDILPSARLLGPLTYQGPREAQVASGAVISGPITFDRISEREVRRERSSRTVSGLLFSVHLFLAGLLVVIFLPRVESSVVATLRAQPGKSLLVGFVLLVTIPVAALLLALSILGLPIGLAMGALYLIALFGAVLVTAFFVGDAEARLFKAGPISTRGQHALFLLAGVLTLALLRSVLGGVIVLASVLFGIGALTLSAYQTYSRQPTPTPA